MERNKKFTYGRIILLLKSKGIVSDLEPDSIMFYLIDGTALAEFYLAYRKSF